MCCLRLVGFLALLCATPGVIEGQSGEIQCDPPCKRGACLTFFRFFPGCICDEGFDGQSCDTDTMPPELECPGDLYEPTYNGKNFTSVTFDPIRMSDNDGSKPELYLYPESGSTFYFGENNIEMKAVDNSGNEATCSFVIYVQDEESPVVECPPNVTYNLNDGELHKVVNFTAVSVTDNVDRNGTTSIRSNPRSGSKFPLGVNLVEMEAEDKSGNIGRCKFTVTILDLFACEDGSLLEKDVECNGVWDCPDGVDEYNCVPEAINGTSLLHPSNQNGVWKFEITEGLGIHIIFFQSYNYGRLTVGEGGVPWEYILHEESNLTSILDIFLPTNSIWIIYQSSSSNEKGLLEIFVESTTVTSPIHIEDEPFILRSNYSYDNPIKSVYLWRVTVEEGQWLTGSFSTYEREVEVAMRKSDDNALVNIGHSQDFIYPVEEIWIKSSRRREFLLNLSSHNPQVIQVPEGDKHIVSVYPSLTSRCSLESWIIELPQPFQFAMKFLNTSIAQRGRRLIFFEGDLSSMTPVGIFYSSQSQTVVETSFVTHLTKGTVGIVSTPSALCQYEDSTLDQTYVDLEFKPVNLTVEIENGEVFLMSSAQESYTDDLFFNRRLFTSNKELFVEANLPFLGCSTFYNGPLDMSIASLDSPPPVTSSFITSSEDLGVLNTVSLYSTTESRCSYNVRVQSSVPHVGYMVCPETTVVIKEDQICDAVLDCPTHEDEIGCEPTHVDIRAPVELIIPAVTSKDTVYSFQKNSSEYYFVVNGTLLQYYGSSNKFVLESGSGPYFGKKSSPTATFQKKDLSNNKWLIFTDNVIWIKITSLDQNVIFWGSLAVVRASEYIDCGNNFAVATEYRCDGLHHCSNGFDETNCAPLEVNQRIELSLPSFFQETIIWTFTTEDGNVFVLNLDNDESRYDYHYIAVGTGSYYSENASTIVECSRYDSIESSIIIHYETIWIRIETLHSLSSSSPGTLNVYHINDVTPETTEEASSPNYPSYTTPNEVLQWIYRFPTGMGGVIHCDDISLVLGQTLEIGTIENVSQKTIVDLRDHYSYDTADVQIPSETAWIKFNYAFTSYGSYRFHCSVSAANTTVKLIPGESREIVYLGEDDKFIWIGWNIQTPEMFGTYFSFGNEELSDLTVGVGNDFQRNVTSDFLFQLSGEHENRNVAIQGSAWTFLSTYRCDFRCEWSYTISALNMEDLFFCTESIAAVTSTVVCDGIPDCPYGDDEIGCEIAEEEIVSIFTTGYPTNRPADIMQKWEYHTQKENVTIIVHFRELFLGYSDTFYAGVGELSPENSSVDYRPAQDCYLTRYDPVQDLYLESNMIWIVIASSNYASRGKLWAEIRVISNSEEIQRCNDGSHIAARDQICDNLWTCEDGEDEVGCDVVSILEEDDAFSIEFSNTIYVREEMYSWTFSTNVNESAFAIVLIRDALSTFQLTIGTGNDFLDVRSVQKVIYRSNGFDVTYIMGNEIWLVLEGTPTNDAVNVTVVPLSGLYLCEGSDQLIMADKFCNTEWDCESGNDELYCEVNVTSGTTFEASSKDYPLRSNNTQDRSWIYLFPDGMGGLIQCDDISLAYGQTLEIGTGENVFQLNGTVAVLRDSYSYDKAEIQIPSQTVWIKFNYGTSSSSRYHSFHCSVSAVNPTLTLGAGETLDITYQVEPDEFVWIGWNVETPQFYSTSFIFGDEDLSRVNVGVGNDFERSVTPVYLRESSNDNRDIVINGSAWTFLSTYRCYYSYSSCYWSYTISAVDLKELHFCEGSDLAIHPDDLCNNIWDCENGTDEANCEVNITAGTILEVTSPNYPSRSYDRETRSWMYRFPAGMGGLLQCDEVSLARYTEQTLEIGIGDKVFQSDGTVVALRHSYYYDLYYDKAEIQIPSETVWMKFTYGTSSYSYSYSFHCSVSAVSATLTLRPEETLDITYRVEDDEFAWIGWNVETPQFYSTYFNFGDEDLSHVNVGVGNDFERSVTPAYLRESSYDNTNIFINGSVWTFLSTYHCYSFNSPCYWSYTISAVNPQELHFCEGSGLVINSDDTCNNVWDCEDGSDEAYCEVNVTTTGTITEMSSPDYPLRSSDTQDRSWFYRFPVTMGGLVQCDHISLAYGQTLEIGTSKNLDRTVAVLRDSYYYDKAEIQIPSETVWIKFTYGSSSYRRFYSFHCSVSAVNATLTLGPDETSEITYVAEIDEFVWIGWDIQTPETLSTYLSFGDEELSLITIGVGVDFGSDVTPENLFQSGDLIHDIVITGLTWTYLSTYRCYDYSCEWSYKVSAVNTQDLFSCRESSLVLKSTMVCNGEPTCPYGDDEIGCEIAEDEVVTLLTTRYPNNRPTNIMQKWEYHIQEENVTMIVHFRELFLGYSDTFYAGVGELSPENSSVDYRPAQDCYRTRYDPVQDLYLESNMIWIVLTTDSFAESGRLWAEVRVVKENEEILRCDDGSHIAASDQICDNLWTCENGDDEVGCEAAILLEWETFSIEFLNPPSSGTNTEYSWSFATNATESAFAIVPLGNSFSDLQLTIGIGTNVLDNESVQRVFHPSDNLDTTYIVGREMWLRLRGMPTNEAINITVIPVSELHLCEGSEQAVGRDKLCNNAWECDSGSDESNCDSISLNERDNYGFSLSRSYGDTYATYSWIFDIPDEMEALLELKSVNMHRAQISIGSGSNPSDVKTRLIASIDDVEKLELIIPAKQFWIKTIVAEGYNILEGMVEIKPVLIQDGDCSDDEFQCLYTRECIASNQMCNGNFECDDRSDESTCDCSSPLEVRNGVGECVLRWSLCTGYSYSTGAASLDEMVNCDFKCSTSLPGRTMISNKFICDGFQDCIDGSDEEVENCECTRPAFSCGEKCLTPNEVCDGVVDCEDGRDERDCECSSFEITCDEDCFTYWDGCMLERCMDRNVCRACPSNYFQCQDYTCLPAASVCNDVRDCNNGEDEEGCPYIRSVRLVGGSRQNEGRVEVFHDGEWGTVCDDWWSSNDAAVVCRQLGFGDSGVALSYATFGRGEGPIWLDNVACTGSELKLEECRSNGWGIHNCGHYDDAGVRCEIDMPTLRLRGGSSEYEGRVEVFYQGQWGTICDDDWDEHDAAVICRQLDLGELGQAITFAQYGNGVGPIWLDNVECEGHEDDLESCISNEWGDHNCGHHEDAGVICTQELTTFQPDNRASTDFTKLSTVQPDNQVSTDFSELLPVQPDNEVPTDFMELYTVEPDNRVSTDGKDISTFQPDNQFSSLSTGKPIQDETIVPNLEDKTSVSNLEYLNTEDPTSFTTLAYSDDLMTTETPSLLPDKPVTILSPGYPKSLPEFTNGTWIISAPSGYGVQFEVVDVNIGSLSDLHLGVGTVSDTNCIAEINENSGRHNKTFLLRSNIVWLKFLSRYSFTTKRGFFVKLTAVDGIGIRDTFTLIKNEAITIESTNYPENYPVTVDDVWNFEVEENLAFTVKFLDISLEENWDYVSIGTGKEPGFSPTYMKVTGNTIPGDQVLKTRRMWMRFTSDLSNTSRGFRVEVTAVESRTPPAVRLVGGTMENEGRVEIFHNGIWGTVCDDYWGDPDAQVVCRELGFEGDAEAVRFAIFGAGTGQIWLDDVHCSGSESRLEDCTNRGWGNHNCGHYEDAGVRCQDEYIGFTNIAGTIRLVGGSSTNEGRVEILNNGVWGTICDDNWDNNDAQVVCRELGFAGDGDALYYGFTVGTDQIWLNNIGCSGFETRLEDCSNSGWGNHYSCNHYEDAGVRCEGGIVATSNLPTDIRLVGGSAENEGRVEIFYNGIWGTVCDDSWSSSDAKVVCKQLGYGNSGEAVLYSGFGGGTGQIWLDNVYCIGSERRLEDCGSRGWGTHNCDHSDDAGVRCQGGDYSLVSNSSRTISFLRSTYGYDEVNWNFTAPENHTIHISLSSVNIDNSELEILIFLPTYTEGLPIARYEGLSSSNVLQVMSSRVTMTYTSAYSSSGDSFIATVTAVPDIGLECDSDKIPDDVRCDGRTDCPGGIDELNCAFDTDYNETEGSVISDYLVKISGSNGMTCGGTLINSRWILTAAGCLTAHSSAEYEVLLKVGDFPRTVPDGDIYSTVAQIDISSQSRDESGLALLKLDRPVEGFGTDIFPLSLPQSERNVDPGTYVNIVGWSSTLPGDDAEARVTVNREPVVSEEFCMRRQYPSFSVGRVFCTGYIQSYGTDCFNIYGGPVVYDRGNNRGQEIIGVVVEQDASWECGQPFAPKMYPLVSSQVDYIKDIMRYV